MLAAILLIPSAFEKSGFSAWIPHRGHNDSPQPLLACGVSGCRRPALTSVW